MQLANTMCYILYYVTDLNDFSDERIFEVLIKFYAVVHQHVLKQQQHEIPKYFTLIDYIIKLNY